MSRFHTLNKTLLSSLIAVAMSATIVACGGGDGGTGATTTNDASSATVYNGAGSSWSISLNDNGTFQIDYRDSIDSDILLVVNGDYVRHDSGFVSLTVTDAEGEDAPVAGDAAWAIEVPGYAFMLNPIGSEQLIAMVTAGNCPTEDLNANWVIVKSDSSGGDSNATGTDRDFAGTFQLNAATGVPNLPVKKSLADGFPTVTGGGIDPGDVVCENGIMNIPGAVMYLTENGGAIVHTDGGSPGDESDDQIIFGLGQKEILNVTEADGNYAGMLFDDNMSDGTKLNPVSLQCTSGTCIGTMVTDVATGATSADSVTVTLSNSVNEIGATTGLNGFLTGTISDGGGNDGNMICMADPDANGSGKKIVSCVGQSPGDNDEMFNVLFVSI